MRSVQLQSAMRKRVTAVLGQDQVRDLHRPAAGRTLFALAHIWLAVAFTFWLGAQALALSPWFCAPALLLLSCFNATRINALNVLVHEGSHFALAPDRSLNTRFTNIGAGYWILFDEDSYRKLHLQHHRLLNEAGDPDLPLYSVSRKRRRLFNDLLRDLFWVSIAKRAAVYRDQGAFRAKTAAGASNAALLQLAAKLGANLVLLLLLVATTGPMHGVVLYGVLWVLPLFSLYPMIIRLRTIAEHFAPEVFTPGAAAVFVARTSVCGPLEHYLLGAQMDYHFEHHLFPGIPYHQLARMHAALVERDFFDASPAKGDHVLTGGYLHFWSRFLASEYFDDGSRARPA